MQSNVTLNNKPITKAKTASSKCPPNIKAKQNEFNAAPKQIIQSGFGGAFSIRSSNASTCFGSDVYCLRSKRRDKLLTWETFWRFTEVFVTR